MPVIIYKRNQDLFTQTHMETTQEKITFLQQTFGRREVLSPSAVCSIKLILKKYSIEALNVVVESNIKFVSILAQEALAKR